MKMPMSKTRQPQKFDFILAFIVLAIFVASILAIYSSFPLIPSYLQPTQLLAKQIIFYILGFILIGIIIYLSNDHLFELAKIAYYILMIMLLYLLAFIVLQRLSGNGMLPFIKPVNGATSWIEFPVFGTLQPSEFMKVVLIIIAAYVIIDHNEDKEDDSFESDISLFFKLGKWLLPPLILIILQPDTGLPIIIIVSLSLMLMCSGIRREWIIAIFAIIFIAILIFLYFFYFDQPTFSRFFPKKSYKVRRIYGWLYPEQNATGDGMQLYSALLAMGSSGLSGHGFHTNIIFILEGHTDFIFAIIGMNFGFIGSAITIALCIALDVRLAIISIRSKNNVEKIMIVGFLGMLLFQQIQNIGMVIGFFPITGITLPLISYGGSSVLSYLIAIGIVMNASMRAKKLSDYVYE